MTSEDKAMGYAAIMSSPMLYDAASLRHSSEKAFEAGNKVEAVMLTEMSLDCLRLSAHPKVIAAVEARLKEMKESCGQAET